MFKPKTMIKQKYVLSDLGDATGAGLLNNHNNGWELVFTSRLKYKEKIF